MDTNGSSNVASAVALSQTIRSAVEIAVRLGAIALMVGWCLLIIAPFLGIVAWALIIAIAMDGPFETLCRQLGGRRIPAALLFVGLAFVLIFGPTILLSESLISATQHFAHEVKDQDFAVPPPNPAVRSIPLVGSLVYEAWERASENLVGTLARFEPQLRTLSAWLLKTAGSFGAGVLQLLASILIASVMLIRSPQRQIAVARFANRMAGPVRGPQLAAIATSTVRSVVQGILGVAAIQAFLAGIGFMLAGIPWAGLWALLVLVAAIVQIPVALAMIVPVVIGFMQVGGGIAIALAVWCAAIGLIDNVLKPILFGRGVKVPMLVIFMGAIGGMLTMGIIGLFLGAVALALGFELFMAWLDDGVPQVAATPTEGA
jgi:predicted PurR-regulated permease PerM